MPESHSCLSYTTSCWQDYICSTRKRRQSLLRPLRMQRQRSILLGKEAIARSFIIRSVGDDSNKRQHATAALLSASREGQSPSSSYASTRTSWPSQILRFTKHQAWRKHADTVLSSAFSGVVSKTLTEDHGRQSKQGRFDRGNYLGRYCSTAPAYTSPRWPLILHGRERIQHVVIHDAVGFDSISQHTVSNCI
jgi:hypothetical protein